MGKMRFDELPREERENIEFAATCLAEGTWLDDVDVELLLRTINRLLEVPGIPGYDPADYQDEGNGPRTTDH